MALRIFGEASEALRIFGECSTMRAGSLRGNIPLCSTAFGDQMKSTSFCFLDGLIVLTPYSLAGEMGGLPHSYNNRSLSRNPVNSAGDVMMSGGAPLVWWGWLAGRALE